MKPKLPDHTIIEVIMRKQMTVKEYYSIRQGAIKEGWSCQGYESKNN